MTPQTYLFEDEHRTVREIRELVPALSENSIRTLCKRGVTTRQAMLEWNPEAAVRRGARKGARASGLDRYAGVYRRDRSQP